MRSPRRPAALAVAVSCLIALAAGLVVPSPAAADPASEFLALVNGHRASNGLPPLRLSPILTASAWAKSQDMVANGYFSHWSPSGVGPEDLKVAHGYPPNSPGWGENILWGAWTAAEAFGAWSASADHNANMLSSVYTEIGVGGPASGGSSWGVWTLHFGNAAPAPDTPAAAPPPPAAPDDGGWVPAPSDAGFAVGTAVSVWDGPVNLRDAPGLGGGVLAMLPIGTWGTIVGGPQWADGYAWYQLDTASGWGWVAGAFLGPAA